MNRKAVLVVVMLLSAVNCLPSMAYAFGDSEWRVDAGAGVGFRKLTEWGDWASSWHWPLGASISIGKKDFPLMFAIGYDASKGRYASANYEVSETEFLASLKWFINDSGKWNDYLFLGGTTLNLKEYSTCGACTPYDFSDTVSGLIFGVGTQRIFDNHLFFDFEVRGTSFGRMKNGASPNYAHLYLSFGYSFQ